MIERALISAFDKTGLDEFARGLAELGVELVASGGTADHLEEHGLEVTRVEELTEIPELLGGRVKTLHPRIHAAILARRDHPDDLAALDEHDIQPFDLVCVNLYPFTQVVSRHGVKEEDAVEMIDIGGPSMLRGAAKNFAHVAPVCRPERYGSILAELREIGRDLARDAAGARRRGVRADGRLRGRDRALVRRPRRLPRARSCPSFEKVTDLAYGENPHQRAAYYAERGARRHLLSRVEQLHGRAALVQQPATTCRAAACCCASSTVPACVIVKHANPCGVAVAASIEEAYERALASDPMSAFGDGRACSTGRSAPSSAGRSRSSSSRCCSRPTTTSDALEALRAEAEHADPRRPRAAPLRPRRARLQARARRAARPGPRLGRRGPRGDGGRLRRAVRGRAGATCSSRGASASTSTSNAIVLAKDLQTIGIGAGQMSRVDAVRIARREGARARPRPRGRRARLRRVLPVPGRPAGRARGRRHGDHPAGRLEARRRR